VVGDLVTFTFPVTYRLPGGFDCEQCTFEAGEGYLAGDDPPVQSGDTVVVQRRVLRPGMVTVQLHVRETTEEECYYPDPVLGCWMYFQWAFIEASSAPFNLQLAETASCGGDCDGGGTVTVDELITMVDVALGTEDVTTCSAGDRDADGQIRVDELVTAVNNALEGCGPIIGITPSSVSLGCEGSFDLVITNAGPAGSTLVINSFTLANRYSQGYYGTGFQWDLSQLTLPLSLTSGATVTVPVTFSAAGQSYRSALVLSCESNAVNSPYISRLYPAGSESDCSAYCGDGEVNQPEEQCDPPPLFCRGGCNPYTGLCVDIPCRSDCTCPQPECGDRVIDPGEDCDPPGSPCAEAEVVPQFGAGHSEVL
jgi:hypothetical protein